jgi:glycopeptide antibiotics resistance protein
LVRYVEHFSREFELALLLWPFLAAFLTLPILLWQYARYRRVLLGHCLLAYAFVLYAVAAFVIFPLYPLPADPQALLAKPRIQPQLRPFQFVLDMRKDGLVALFQVVLNMALFFPLGVFARKYFGLRRVPAALVACGLSVLVEAAQLTGDFWLYPAPYRLCDVDDVIANTAGAVLGYALAAPLPDFSHPQILHGVNKDPGAVQRLVALFADTLALAGLALLTHVAAHVCLGAMPPAPAVTLAWFAILQFLCPLALGGRTPALALTGASLDDRPRRGLHRAAFYAARALFVGAVVFARGIPQLAAAILGCACWFDFRRLPYAWADRLFRDRPAPPALDRCD